MTIEYAGRIEYAGDPNALKGLAQAVGMELRDVVALAARNELATLFRGGRRYVIRSAPRESDTPDTANPRAAQLSLLMKRRPPT